MLPSLNTNLVNFVAQVDNACVALGFPNVDPSAVADALIRDRPGMLLHGVMKPVPDDALRIIVGRVLKSEAHKFARAPIPKPRTLWQRLWGVKS